MNSCPAVPAKVKWRQPAEVKWCLMSAWQIAKYCVSSATTMQILAKKYVQSSYILDFWLFIGNYIRTGCQPPQFDSSKMCSTEYHTKTEQGQPLGTIEEWTYLLTYLVGFFLLLAPFVIPLRIILTFNFNGSFLKSNWIFFIRPYPLPIGNLEGRKWRRKIS